MSTARRRRGAAVLALVVLLAGGVAGCRPGSPTTAPGAVAAATSSPAAAATPAGATASDPRATALVLRAAAANRTVDYEGTVAVTVRGSGGSSSVVLAARQDGGGAASLRVVARTTSASSPAAPAAGAPSVSDLARVFELAETALALLPRTHALDLDGSQVVAGRRADVVSVDDADGRPAARLWLDRSTGLLLRRDVYASSGALWQTTAFLGLDLDVDLARAATGGSAEQPGVPSSAPTAATGGAAWGQRLDRDQLAELTGAGWTCPQELPGGLLLVDARSEDAGPDRVVHLGYSDGLSVVSVFQQPGSLPSGGPAGWRRSASSTGVAGAVVWERPGVPARTTWSSGGRVYTVVADGPAAVVQRAVAALPHQAPPRPSRWDRVRRGLHRLGSWFDPSS